MTAERIRDKIAASKKQGLWMGGLPPLGYDPHPDKMVRELVVNQTEAETVRTLFQLYLDHGSLVATERAAARMGLLSKRRQFASGRTTGGHPLSRGQIHHILTNPIYRGQIRHHDKLWPGRHPAIIDAALWAAVQAALQSTARRRRARGSKGDAMQAPLTGKLRDETGDRLTPTHATKSGRRHRYYVSNRLISGGHDATGWRLPAKQLETLVGTLVADHLSQAAREASLLAHPDLRASDGLAEAVRPVAETLRRGDGKLLVTLIEAGTIDPRSISLALDRTAIAALLSITADELAADVLQVERSLALRRRGVEARLVVGMPKSQVDPILLRTLRDAHRWVEALRSGKPMSTLAQEAGHHEAHIRTRAQLAFLSPKIQAAIKAGTLSPNVTLEHILKQKLPLDWSAQEQRLGV